MQNIFAQLNFKDWINTNRKSKIWVQGIGWFIFIFFFAFLEYFLIFHGKFFLNSDICSQLVLGNILSNEHSFLSKNWYYGNELYILNAQFFYQFLFYLTNNWALVRIIGSTILYLCILASFFKLCNECEIIYAYPFMATILILPISQNYLDNMLIGLFYIPYCAISFFILSLAIHIIKFQKINKWLFLVAIAISFVTGISGLRQIFVLNIPLITTAFFLVILSDSKNKKIKYFCYFTAILFFFSVFGYIYYKSVLSSIYYVRNFDESLNFTFPTFIKLNNSINAILEVFGYKSGKVFSKIILINTSVILVILVILVAYIDFWKNGKKYRTEEKIIFLFFINSLVLFEILYLFTDQNLQPRYFIPMIVFGIPVSFIAIKYHINNFYVKKVYTITFVLITVYSITSYIDIFNHKYTESLITLTKELIKKEYFEGYSNYWSAPIITEYSNGEIQMRHYATGIENVESPFYTAKYFQKKSNSRTFPKGKFFVLLSNDEFSRLNFANKIISAPLIFKNDYYSAYGFNTVKELFDILYTTNLNDKKIKNDTQFLWGCSENDLSYSDNYLTIKNAWVLKNGDNAQDINVYLHMGEYYFRCERKQRWDVVNFFGNQDYLFSGFECCVPVYDLNYDISIIALDKEGNYSEKYIGKLTDKRMEN